VVGFIDDVRTEGPLPVFGGISALSAVLGRQRVGEVVVADQRLTHGQILDIVAICDRARVSVKIFPDLFHLAVNEVSPSEFGGLPMLSVRDVSLRGWNQRLKRAMDVVLAVVLLVVFAPLMMAVALVVKLTSPGPVLFVQDRVGIDGRPFPCVKFRSMRVDAERGTGPVWAQADDDRTTAIGRFLRRFSIDELPQLVNVLMGDMSLVGPRPERPFFVEQFSRLVPRYDKRHREKAGVTGWAQVNGLRGQSSIEERTLYDLFYVEHWSPAFDLKIILKTIAAVVRGRNAY
jgi:exopolysaccharide biosynthesis polyprenyl glycosylphosphotransferase